MDSRNGQQALKACSLTLELAVGLARKCSLTYFRKSVFLVRKGLRK